MKELKNDLIDEPRLWERIRTLELRLQQLCLDLGRIVKEVKAFGEKNGT